MWFHEDDKTVFTELLPSDSMDGIETVIRFVCLRGMPYGDQTFCGRQGWFCAYLVITDRDYERIRDKLEFNKMDYPVLDVPGGVSFFNKVEIRFVEEDLNPGFAVIGWDYNHQEESEKGIS
jgi:hypothetical protein